MHHYAHILTVTPLLGPAKVKLCPTHVLKLTLQAGCPTTWRALYQSPVQLAACTHEEARLYTQLFCA